MFYTYFFDVICIFVLILDTAQYTRHVTGYGAR